MSLTIRLLCRGLVSCFLCEKKKVHKMKAKSEDMSISLFSRVFNLAMRNIFFSVLHCNL